MSQPFVPASSHVRELTAQSFLLGLLLSVVFAAANIYLGLYAGLTVSASIPAAVLSMGILRGLLRRGTILENNIVQTMADSGETMAAGVIFTVPALLLTGVWSTIEFWPTVIIAISGSLLGALFMLPLRRAHIVEDENLTFPEGLACAQVLIAGEKGGGGARYLIGSMVVGGLFKFFTSGFTLFKASIERVFPAGGTSFFLGGDVSPALLGLGYIIGLNVAGVVFLGAVLTWGLAVPLHGAIHGIGGDPLDWFYATWKNQGRYLGVGAMLVGGISSIFSVRHAVIQGVREAFSRLDTGSRSRQVVRTEEEMSMPTLLLLLAATIAAAFGLCWYLLGSLGVAVPAALLAVVLSAFFSAVGSYICGLIGGSNMPISGMTICSVILAGALLLLGGVSGTPGIVATLVIAALVCCASSGAGDMAQNLMTGYIVGATPRKQQWMNVVGAIVPALVIAPVLVVLNHAYGIGTGAPGSMKAPQAALFASLAEGMFGRGNIPWTQVGYGAGIGIAILVLDGFLKRRGAKFRLPVMGVAIGMYLPLTTSFPIFLGGLVAAAAKNNRETGSGVLFSSGLIAGEAIMGVAIGAAIYANPSSLPIGGFDSVAVTLLAAVCLIVGLFRVASREKG